MNVYGGSGDIDYSVEVYASAALPLEKEPPGSSKQEVFWASETVYTF
jgi:hypothetical protein